MWLLVEFILEDVGSRLYIALLWVEHNLQLLEELLLIHSGRFCLREAARQSIGVSTAKFTFKDRVRIFPSFQRLLLFSGDHKGLSEQELRI